MQMKRRYLYSIGVITIMTYGIIGCIDVLETDLEINSPILVVQASLVDTIFDGMSESYPMEVSVFSLEPSKSEYVDGALSEFGVTDVAVSIVDTDGNTYGLTHRGEGLYTGDALGKPEVGYRLEILLPEGSTITSDIEYLTSSTATIDSLSLTTNDVLVDAGGNLVPAVEVGAVVNYTNPSAEASHFLYKSSRQYEFKEDPTLSFPKVCYIQEPINPLATTIKSIRSDQEQVGLVASLSEYDRRFAFTLFFHIYQYHISESTYAYYEQVELNKSQSDALFAPIPGQIKTNITLEGDDDRSLQGYFTVASVDYQRVKANALLLDKIQIFGCPANSSRPWSSSPLMEVCGDCLLNANSTVERPDYW